jgi:SGNH hydrolase-like domain, acetyltransferase AlgX
LKRTWLLGGLTALVSAGSAVFVTEMALHIVDYPPEQVSHQRLFVEYDSILGWRNIPGATGRMTSDEYSNELVYNERSMRGPVVSYDKPDGVRRVVLVGDSFVDGYTQPLGERVGDVLEKLLNAADPARRTEVISLGAGGYSTDQELLWLGSEGLLYHPDVVVLLFYYNDIWYNRLDRYWRGGKPLFSVHGDSLVLTNEPIAPPASNDAGREPGLNGWIRAHSKIYWLLARVIQNQPRLFGLAVRMGLTEPSPELVFDRGQGIVIPGEFSVFRSPLPAQAEDAWSITDALVERMRSESEAAGAAFVAMLVPIRSRIYTENDDLRGNAGGGTGIDVDAVTRRFLQLCHSADIGCIDPTSTFVATADSLRASGERLYYRYDWHWNARGHALAARILADSIASLPAARNAIPPAPAR